MMSEHNNRSVVDRSRQDSSTPTPASRSMDKLHGSPGDAPVWEHAPARQERDVRERPDREPTSKPRAEDAGPNARPPADRGRQGWFRRHPVLVAMGVVCFVLVATAGYLYWDNGRHFETTDDAFIAARQFSIAPKVSGYIAAVPVTDNQHVDAGVVIARIDDRDYRTALAQAQAQVAAAQAGIQNIDAQIAAQQAQIAQNQAQVEQAQAALVFAQQEAARYTELARTGAGSVQNAQQRSSALRQQEATLKTNQAALSAAQRQLASLKAQRESAEASRAQAEAQRDQAQLNLSYTTIAAAQPGRIVQLSAATGEYVQAGTALTMFVPDDIWVTANFKETQLDRMRPGEPLTLRVDAYPEQTILGHVASVQPGSGPAFSLLPPQNATGNYVKIVQRVPVKLVLDNPPADIALGPGMSVEPKVRVDPQPSLYERLRGWL